MSELLKKNKLIFSLLLIVFIYLNIQIVNNLGLYNDDWFFFFANNSNKNWSISSLDWFRVMWLMEGGIQRHIIVPYYAFFHKFSIKFLYIFSIFLSLIIFYQIFILFQKIYKHEPASEFSNEINLSIIFLILSWYFFPFNIGGQFWLTGIIHTKLSTIFLFTSILLIINNKLFLSLLFLCLCFNSYEIYFFSYLPLFAIFFYKKLINKKTFKIFIFLSFFIQIFFLFLKKRPSHNFDFIKILKLFYYNFYRFLWSIYQVVPENLNFFIKFFLFFIFSLLILFLCRNFLFLDPKKKKFKISILIFLIFALAGNSLVHIIGTYGYWGKGIFSRTMFAPSIFLLFLLIVFISDISKRKNLFICIAIFFTSVFFFNLEMQNWKISKKIQKDILKQYFIKKNDFSSSRKNFIFFFGPCYYNGVEIFNAPWDLSNAIYDQDNSFFIKSNFIIPIQDWSVQKVNSEVFKIHVFEYKLDSNVNYYYWDYFKKKIIKINSKSAENLVNLVNIYRNDQSCYLAGNEKLRIDKARKLFRFLKFFN
jgi:hypothetical protein